MLEYYREYAAEAGLDDYDRLAAHFGPPQGFAGQLAGELAAHRPAPAADDTVRAGIRGLLGSLFAGSSAGQTPPQQGGQTLEPFAGADIHVASAGVRFEEGEAFALRYCLPAEERIERCEVADGTLHFATRAGRVGGSVRLHFGGMGIDLNAAEYAVVITIPRGAQLGDLAVATVSGDCRLCGRTLAGLRFSSTSGGLTLACVDCNAAAFTTISGDLAARTLGCDTLTARTTSGDILLEEVSADRINCRTVSGDVRFTGSTDRFRAKTASGDCKCLGGMAVSAELETVSGDLSIRTAGGAAIAANTVSGDITLDGAGTGRSLARPGGAPRPDAAQHQRRHRHCHTVTGRPAGVLRRDGPHRGRPSHPAPALLPFLRAHSFAAARPAFLLLPHLLRGCGRKLRFCRRYAKIPLLL